MGYIIAIIIAIALFSAIGRYIKEHAGFFLTIFAIAAIVGTIILFEIDIDTVINIALKVLLVAASIFILFCIYIGIKRSKIPGIITKALQAYVSTNGLVNKNKISLYSIKLSNDAIYNVDKISGMDVEDYIEKQYVEYAEKIINTSINTNIKKRQILFESEFNFCKDYLAGENKKIAAYFNETKFIILDTVFLNKLFYKKISDVVMKKGNEMTMFDSQQLYDNCKEIQGYFCKENNDNKYADCFKDVVSAVFNEDVLKGNYKLIQNNIYQSTTQPINNLTTGDEFCFD